MSSSKLAGGATVAGFGDSHVLGFMAGAGMAGAAGALLERAWLMGWNSARDRKHLEALKEAAKCSSTP